MCCIYAVWIHQIKTSHMHNIKPTPHPRALLPISIHHLHRSGPVNDAFPALDVFVVRVWKGGDNLGGRDKKCHLFHGTLEPISRADQPHSPRHLQQLADND